MSYIFDYDSDIVLTGKAKAGVYFIHRTNIDSHLDVFIHVALNFGFFKRITGIVAGVLKESTHNRTWRVDAAIL